MQWVVEEKERVRAIIPRKSRRSEVNECMHSHTSGNERFQQLQRGSKVKADWIRAGIGGSCDAASNHLIFCWSALISTHQKVMKETGKTFFKHEHSCIEIWGKSAKARRKIVGQFSNQGNMGGRLYVNRCQTLSPVAQFFPSQACEPWINLNTYRIWLEDLLSSPELIIWTATLFQSLLSSSYCKS